MTLFLIKGMISTLDVIPILDIFSFDKLLKKELLIDSFLDVATLFPFKADGLVEVPDGLVLNFFNNAVLSLNAKRGKGFEEHLIIRLPLASGFK